MTRQAKMETWQPSPERPGWTFYFGWIALTSLSVPFAFLLTFVVLKIITDMVGDVVYVDGVRHITEDYFFMEVFVPMVSVLTGILQYGLLRRRLPRMGWWVFATVAGWLLWVLLLALPGWLGWIDMPINSLDFVFIGMGLSIGLAQWLLLRRRLARAGWWIAGNGVGWGLLALIIPGNSVDQYGLITLGLVPACATAAMLALLMSRVLSTEPTM
jgi:hypothetical protein